MACWRAEKRGAGSREATGKTVDGLLAGQGRERNKTSEGRARAGEEWAATQRTCAASWLAARLPRPQPRLLPYRHETTKHMQHTKAVPPHP